MKRSGLVERGQIGAHGQKGARVIVGTAVVAVVALVAAVLAPQAGAGPEPPPAIEIGVRTLTGSTGIVAVDPQFGQVLYVEGIDAEDVDGQCFDIVGSTQSCLGTPGAFHIEGEGDTERLFPSLEAHAALGWIAKEGAPVVASLHDLPVDSRVEQYARDEMRLYVHGRLLDILDRAAYGIPLTPDEQKALTFLQNEVLIADRQLAQASVDEYTRFKNQGCAYVPPAAPAYVTAPVPVPGSISSGCRGAIGLGSVFSPPTPSAALFQTWGMYAAADAMNLTSLGHPEVQDNHRAMVRAGVLMGSMIGAGGTGAVTTALVGTNTALAAAITNFLASNSSTLIVGGKAVTAFGAGAAGAIVGVVLFAVVAAALGIWQLIEDSQVGTTLSRRLAAANSTTDPFGLAQLQAANAGRSLEADRETWTSEAALPSYRRAAATDRLAEFVVRWSTVRSSGTVRPDPTVAWPDNATTAADHRFLVATDGGSPVAAESITVPTHDGGWATVRFNDGWLIVTPEGGPPKATVTLEFVDADGNQSYAIRQPATDGSGDQRFSVTTPNGALQPVTTVVDTISYATPGGGVETAQIVTPPGDSPAAARPTVTGTFLPGYNLYLRPNAINADGQLADVEFMDDFDVEWTLERYDEATESWVADTPLTPNTIGSNPTYGAQFSPTRAGRYRAQARLFHPLGLAPDAFGTVAFSVAPPDIEILQLDVIDDHLDEELEVRVRASERMASDSITVQVQWPGEVGSDEPGPVSETTVDCVSGSPCGTDVATLTHPIDVLTDLRGDVTVTLTNSHGGHITRIVPVTTPARPSFTAPPVPPGDDQPGVVTFEEHVVHVQLPAGMGGDPNYVVAGITPGDDGDPEPSLIITDPANPGPPMVALDVRGDGTFLISIDEEGGEPVVVLRGVPRAEDIGTYEVPVVVQQSNGARRHLVLLIDVVPAPDDLYRAGLFSEVDPLDFVEDGPPEAEVRLLGGQDEWGGYDGQVCIGLDRGFSDEEYCGDAAEFFEPDGTPRPFPYHRLAPHGLEAGGGVIRIRAWLPEDEHTFAEPMEVAFILQPGTEPPEITELSWDADEALATLEVEPSDPDVPVESVACWIDGAPLGSCFAPEGGTWAPPLLAPGEHELEVLVVDARANYDTASMAFEVVDPGLPTAVPGAGEVLEGDSGTAVLRVPITLTHPVAHEVTLEWSTVPVGALIFDQGVPGVDYEASSGTVTFAPGQLTAEAEIPVVGDTEVELDEVVVVSFRNAAGARLGGFWGLGLGAIVDDDAPIESGLVEGTEGDEDVVVSVPVSLRQPFDEEVGVSWTTAFHGHILGREAEPGDDYEVTSGTVIFTPGQTEAFVEVTVRADALVEEDELVFVRFEGPLGTGASVIRHGGILIHDRP